MDNQPETALPDQKSPTTSTGMQQNVAGLLCYLLGLVTGIVFVVIEKENRFVRFHAFQSIFISVALIILNTVLAAIPLIGWIFALLMSPLGFILWLVLMFKAYKGEQFKLPIVGELAEKQLQ